MPGVPGGDALSNPRSERVRAVRALAGRSARLRSGTFLAEGPQAVREAVLEAARLRAGGGADAGAALVRCVYATDDGASRHRDVIGAALAAGVPVRRCTEEVLAAMADTLTPQGLLAVCALVSRPLPDALSPAPALVAVLSQVRDPGNAGTVLRAADAAGAGAVVLTRGSVDVHNPKCVRSTAGSLFHLGVVEDADPAAAVAALRAAGLVVLAADGGDPAALDLDDLLDDASAGRGPLAGPAAWVFGNEAHGLAEDERALADAVVRVPLHGRAESLNLATAAAVCLYASARGQRRRGAATAAAAGSSA
ncbi:RNA methyltransferase [Quadrisphaera sp. DSM 44207]|uniref:TrmH family RNA methyltransferase n=1 Tax=Quadrisphaera sp. DSM 44207 TaxID=1881057 RepID=UPI000881D7F5|nr:RNA methyltransferase [Quadrisphaera sp. DSM 44207]SDQ52136.1 RNA methyltransferase, TrmH family [Quadrisphaera sp. DSM 44207]